MIIDGVYVSDEINEAEARAYIKRAPEGTFRITAEPDGDYINLTYEYGDGRPFERIRRITGYLVGDLDRFNDAKLSEVKDRVKHGLTGAFPND